MTPASSAATTSSAHAQRLDASLTWRIRGHHALTLRDLGNRRDAELPGVPDGKQVRNTVGIFYTLLGQDGFGGVDWR